MPLIKTASLSRETSAASACSTSSKATPTKCQLCLEDQPIYQLSQCSHPGCRPCLTKWIERAENSGQEDLPICPFCRVPFQHADMLALIKRPFQPRQELFPAQPAEMDELARQYLEAYTKPCPSCHAPIELVDGCDMLECLCGYRFCFKCGCRNARCSCTPSNHQFHDNVLNRVSLRRNIVTEIAPEGQPVDIKAHIAQRRRQAKKELVQMQREALKSRHLRRRQFNRRTRANRHIALQKEINGADETVLAGRWMFGCASTEAGVNRVLPQLMAATKVRLQRKTKRVCAKREQDAQGPTSAYHKCLFVSRKAGLRMLEQMVAAPKVRQQRSTRSRQLERELKAFHAAPHLPNQLIFSRRFILSKENQQRLAKRHAVRVKRGDQRKKTISEQNNIYYNGIVMAARWMFVNKRSTMTKLLKNQVQAAMVRGGRALRARKASCELGAAGSTEFCPRWFQSNTTMAATMKALNHELGLDAYKMRQKRRVQRLRQLHELSRGKTSCEAAISSGVWLFEPGMHKWLRQGFRHLKVGRPHKACTKCKQRGQGENWFSRIRSVPQPRRLCTACFAWIAM